MGKDDETTPETKSATSTCVDWYSEGETRAVEVDGVRVVVRFVGRKGRRGRILIKAPPGAVFSSFTMVEGKTGLRSQSDDVR